MRLLVVDDESNLAHALAKGPRQRGYAVGPAFDGMQGLEFAMVNDCNLAIFGLNLPAMDTIPDICCQETVPGNACRGAPLWSPWFFRNAGRPVFSLSKGPGKQINDWRKDLPYEVISNIWQNATRQNSY